VLVVGGGDSALEAALSVAGAGASVTLSYRGDSFSRAKPANRARVDAAAKRSGLEVLLGSTVEEIEPAAVRLATRAGPRRIANDDVIVCAGGILPSEFLRACGIELETAHGKVVG
jgi:thioredoxin reductase